MKISEDMRKSLEMQRARQRRTARVLLSIRTSEGGKVLQQLMQDRSDELLVEHYASQTPVELSKAAENKGAYNELKLWLAMLFESELSTEENDRE